MSPGHRPDDETSAAPDATCHVVYVSRVSAGSTRDVFADICAHARARNPVLGIGGVLLHDGHCFAQWLHGPEAAVRGLMQRIAADPRHEGLQRRLDTVLPLRESARPWRAGRTAPEVLPAFMQRVADEDADVLGEFLSLLPAAELWPPLEAPSAGTATTMPGAGAG